MQLIKEWDSAKDASDALNIVSKNITANCRGERKSAGGYIWIYKETTNGIESIDSRNILKLN